VARYSITQACSAGVETIVLQDELAGSAARIAPDRGARVIGLTVGEWELLDASADDGIRPRFPWPGPLSPDRTAPDAAPSWLEGLSQARWRVGGAAASDAAAVLTCAISHADQPLSKANFPFHFGINLTFRLMDEGLSIEAEVTNTGQGRLPAGFGLDVPLRLPLHPAGTRESCQLIAGAERLWDLDDHGAPTGKTRPAAPLDDFRRPRPLGDRSYRLVFTQVQFCNGLNQSAVLQPDGGREVWLISSADFWQLYLDAPADRPRLVLGPWTCAPNAPDLERRGIPSGLRFLLPRQSWRGRVVVSPRPYRPPATRWYDAFRKDQPSRGPAR
jgi:galactose mutarotase-like enzyme